MHILVNSVESVKGSNRGLMAYFLNRYCILAYTSKCFSFRVADNQTRATNRGLLASLVPGITCAHVSFSVGSCQSRGQTAASYAASVVPGIWCIWYTVDTRSPSPRLYRLITHKFKVTRGPSLRSVKTRGTDPPRCVLHTTTTQKRTCQGHRPTLASSAWSL